MTGGDTARPACRRQSSLRAAPRAAPALPALFDPESHEPLLDSRWSPATIEAAIRKIAADAEAAFDDGWIAHLEDEDDPVRFRSVYIGGAGVIWARDELRRRALVELERDYRPYLEQSYTPDLPETEHRPSLLGGETGIRLVLHRLEPSSENLDRLAALIAANTRDDHLELLWGSPGTMLAAAELQRTTGEERWTKLWQESASWLEEVRDPESGSGRSGSSGDKRATSGP